MNVNVTIPAMTAYANRVGAEQRHFRCWVILKEVASGYFRELYIIRIAHDGTVKVRAADGGEVPDEIKPTADEQAAIKAGAINFPLSITADPRNVDDLRAQLGGDDLFVILDVTRTKVVMCQQRKMLENGSKIYLSWSLFSDGQWRRMEPDVERLPLWKPHQRRHMPRIMVHEGAKAARYCDWLVNDPAARDERARHPWAEHLARFEHWGWIGGAAAPLRTDWNEVKQLNAREVVLAADNDPIGRAAIRPIARELQSVINTRVTALWFDDRFPESFDLADAFPKKLWINGRYRGPTLRACCRPATWATRKIETGKKGQPVYEARPALIEQWLYAKQPKVFVHRDYTDQLLDVDAFNTQMLPFSDVKNTADLLLKKAPHIQVESITYEPGQQQGVVTINGKRLINTWRPTMIARHKGDIKPFLKFMRHLIPIKEDREHLLRWCATLIACPEKRIRYGVLLISVTQGIGKGTLMEKIMAPLVGLHNVSVPDEKELTEGNFNSWVAEIRLVLVHEIYVGQSKKPYNTIKSAVTDDTIRVKKKYLREYEVTNWSHYILASNSELALHLVKNDRRWFVPTVTEIKRSEEFWVEFNAYLANGGLEAIHEWAYAYVKKHKAVGEGAEAPSSTAKQRLIVRSRSEGMDLALNLAEEVMVAKAQIEKTSVCYWYTDPVVLKDIDVRRWVADRREIDLSHRTMESAHTIRNMLKEAGLILVQTGKTQGRRWFAFANPAAVGDGLTWEQQRGLVWSASELAGLMKGDEGEPM